MRNLRGMAQVTHEVVDGKVRYDGRTIADWAPEVSAHLVAACAPVTVILFGSVARGDDGPDSEIDLLVILRDAPPSQRSELKAELRRSVRAPVPVELHVTNRRDFECRRHVVGAIEEAAAHEGRVLHGRPLEKEQRMPDPESQAREAQRWLSRAWEDLHVAQLLAANSDLPPRVACFHAQQAAQKAVKAALVHDAIRFPRTHDLEQTASGSPSSLVGPKRRRGSGLAVALGCGGLLPGGGLGRQRRRRRQGHFGCPLSGGGCLRRLQITRLRSASNGPARRPGTSEVPLGQLPA